MKRIRKLLMAATTIALATLFHPIAGIMSIFALVLLQNFNHRGYKALLKKAHSSVKNIFGSSYTLTNPSAS